MCASRSIHAERQSLTQKRRHHMPGQAQVLYRKIHFSQTAWLAPFLLVETAGMEASQKQEGNFKDW